MNIRRIKDARYKSPYSVAIKVNGKDLSIREEGGQTKIFRSLQGKGDVYLYARQNSDGTFNLTYNDHSKYMQSRSANDNVEESLGTYGLVDVLNTMADFNGPVDDYFFARESSVADSRRVSDSLEDDYEEYLNEVGEGLDDDEFIIGGEDRRPMPYGTAMRQFDPIAFNVGYDEWVRENGLDEDEQSLEHIADLLEEGYHSGYDPQWDIDITVDGADISEFNDDDKDLIYQDIAYVVRDGYDNYSGIETELSDGSVVYVDFQLNY